MKDSDTFMDSLILTLCEMASKSGKHSVFGASTDWLVKTINGVHRSTLVPSMNPSLLSLVLTDKDHHAKQLYINPELMNLGKSEIFEIASDEHYWDVYVCHEAVARKGNAHANGRQRDISIPLNMS